MSDSNRKWIYSSDFSSTCFFRSALNPPELKVMIQVTERCNMHCKHCFLSATGKGNDLSFENFKSHIIDKLIESNVKKVTLTGGEPLLNDSLIDIITILHAAGIRTCICTNASLITEAFLQNISTLNVHFNTSLDGMGHTSHGLFRGNKNQSDFEKILENIHLIGKYKMLNGVLTTPNELSSIDEYISICDFAIESGAKYFLMNPLSPFGRGILASDLVVSSDELNSIKRKIDAHVAKKVNKTNFEVVYIRFPNIDEKPIPACQAGFIPYVFTNGDIAICPYIVFAAENSDNRYSKSDFVIGNIFDNINIIMSMEKYKNEHKFCQCGEKESLGCVAIKVSKNLLLGDSDIL